MQEFKIEKGVPIPPLSRKLGLSGTLRTMRKGDSFQAGKDRVKSVAAVAHAILGSGNYTIRSNGTHFRIWRTG